MSAVPHRNALRTFLRELSTGGHCRISVSGAGSLASCLRAIEADAAADPQVGSLLRGWHGEALENLSGPSLPFDETAARWGAAMLFRTAWLYLHRDAPESEALALLSVTLPVPMSAPALFSADLALHRLPEVHRMARALAPGDPLLTSLQGIAAAHPLSCAALPPAEGQERTPELRAWQVMLSHPGLWRLFIDRVITANARWWFAQPGVATAVKSAAGAFASGLVPALDLSPASPAFHAPAHS